MPHPLEVLKRYLGYDAFRPGQQAVVEKLLAGCAGQNGDPAHCLLL